jgi:sugar phosphate isomerase/epimerase
MELTRLSLNSASVPTATLPDLVRLAEANSLHWVAPWRDIVQAFGIGASARLLRSSGLQISGLCRGGMFTSESGVVRESAIADNLRAIDEAQELGTELLAIVCGPVVGKDVLGSLSMVRDGLERIIDHADSAGVRLGIEPLHPMLAADRSVVTSLAAANALRLAIDHPAIGIIVDTYNVWFDAQFEQEVATIGDGLVGFQLADWVLPLGDPTKSRGMLGDGHIDLGGMVRTMDAAHYTGPIEVEILSAYWAAQPVELVANTIVTRFSSLDI